MKGPGHTQANLPLHGCTGTGDRGTAAHGLPHCTLFAAGMRLRWKTHGLSGVAAVLVGLAICVHALTGALADAVAPRLLATYVAAASANAVAGLGLARRAPAKYVRLFRAAAIFQLGLLYYCWRFSPLAAGTGGWAARLVDTLVCVSTLASGVGSCAVAVFRTPLAVGAGIAAGSLALLVLCVYPLQLTLGGDEWWACIDASYPLQSAAMVAYIYVPASWAFSCIIFGATLWLRKIVSNLTFGAGIGGGALACVLATVLMQEVHFPRVSTQRIYLPCPLPQEGTLGAWWVDALDFSAAAQSALDVARARTGWRLRPADGGNESCMQNSWGAAAFWMWMCDSR